jgi:hypothetical protein
LTASEGTGGRAGKHFAALYNELRIEQRYNNSVDFLKTIGGKIAAAIAALAVVIGVISWLQMDAATRAAIMGGTGKITAWLGIIVLLPWATFFIIGAVAKLENNLAGGGLVTVYTIGEVVLLLWLFGWRGWGPAGWTFVGVGGLLAAVYNVFVCDWIAERLF